MLLHAMYPRRLLAALLLALPVPALAQWTSGLHDTGVVRFEVFDNGKLGAFFDGDSSTIGEGFVFGGENGLFEGAFVVGLSSELVSGDFYDFPDVEWATVSPVSSVVPPDDFDEAYEAVYDDSAAPDPIGLRVTQTTYAGDGHPYVIADFTVENTSDYYLEGIYIGVVADWNVGNYEQNLWDFDDSTNLSYVWDVTGMNENYYGVASIRPYGDTFTISGVSPCAAPGDAALFEGLSGGLTYCNGVPGDVRAILGGGPFDLAPGASRRAVFAFVGGASEVEIIDNAKQAHEWFDCPGPCVANEPSAEDLGVALHVASPNPARDTTTLSFTLAHPQPVRLTILDALGREVVVLVDETRAAGDHRVRWNADDFPAGVYLARLAAGATAASRPITLLR